MDEYKVLSSIAISEVAYELVDEEAYLNEFAKRFDKKRPTILKQVTQLEDMGVVKRKTDPKDKRKQLFYLDFDRITELFFSCYIEAIFNNRLEIVRRHPNPELKKYYNELEAYTSKTSKKLVETGEFQKIFKRAFRNLKMYISMDVYPATIIELYTELASIIIQREDFDYIAESSPDAYNKFLNCLIKANHNMYIYYALTTEMKFT